MQDRMSERLQAIRDELDQAAQALEYAKADYERARVRYEAAREKFRLIRQLAHPMMTMLDFVLWQREHPGVQYAATGMTEAVLDVLRNFAYEAANAVIYGRPNLEFNPWLTLEEITKRLEDGGFDFRTTSPLREVNAALLNMEGRIKDETANTYAVANANDILSFVRTLAERRQ